MHILIFSSSWSSDMAEAAKFPNVYCKLSGLINEVPGKDGSRFGQILSPSLGDKVVPARQSTYNVAWWASTTSTTLCHIGYIVDFIPPVRDYEFGLSIAIRSSCRLNKMLQFYFLFMWYS
jgi:hypothetical protein